MRKLLFLFLGLCFSTALFAETPYRFLSVPHVDIDQYLTPATEEMGIPKNLQGLFWMDGNPLADEVVSFASAHFIPIEENGQIQGYEAWIPVYDEGIWSWHDTLQGRLAYAGVRRSNLIYHVVFNPDFTTGRIIPVAKVLPVPAAPGLEIPQSMLVDFDMTLVNPDEFRRDSRLLGLPHMYRFRRIVDGEGRRLAAYDDYVASIKARGLVNALLPVCKNNRNLTLPTSCARI
jgi:hypothetical protein